LAVGADSEAKQQEDKSEQAAVPVRGRLLQEVAAVGDSSVNFRWGRLHWNA